MGRTLNADDAGKWLGVLAAAVSVGLLPKGWQKGISVATAVLMLLKLA